MYINWLKTNKKKFSVDNSFLKAKQKSLLVVRLKANLYYKKLLYYLSFYISS